ncbi:MAG TPA: hypothetical protein VGE39_07625, partial [Prosthecobacter sp.]
AKKEDRLSKILSQAGEALTKIFSRTGLSDQISAGGGAGDAQRESSRGLEHSRTLPRAWVCLDRVQGPGVLEIRIGMRVGYEPTRVINQSGLPE